MANLGHNPELEEKLYCEDCRGGAHGQVLVYDEPTILERLESKEIKLEGQCTRCGKEYKPESKRRHA